MSRFDLWSRYVAITSRPIFVGPWRSEIGFEVLYWLPFVAQWVHRYGIDSKRLVAISRGGASRWYDAGRTVELLDYVPAADLRVQMLKDHAKASSIKQLEPTDWEQTLLRMISQRLGLRRYHVLHPSVMYQGLAGWWQDTMPISEVMELLRFENPHMPPLPLDIVLPEKFIAVRFYDRPTWALSEETRAYCQQIVRHLGDQMPVVLLGSGAYADDHVDFPLGELPNVSSLVDVFPMRQNLALQSAVLARANAFVGTYGGLMQLAVRLGIPSIGFYTHFANTAYAHKMLTEWLGVRSGVPVFIGRPQEAEFVRSLIGAGLEIPQMMRGSSS